MTPNESAELAAATERIRQYIGGKDLYAVYAGATADDDQRYFEEDIATVLAALASAQRDSARLDALLGLFGPDMGITPDGVHVYSTEDFVDMDKWLSEGGNCDSPELRRAFREAIDSAMKAPTL